MWHVLNAFCEDLSLLSDVKCICNATTFNRAIMPIKRSMRYMDDSKSSSAARMISLQVSSRGGRCSLTLQ